MISAIPEKSLRNIASETTCAPEITARARSASAQLWNAHQPRSKSPSENAAR